MGFIWSCERDGLVNSQPNRLGKLDKALKRLKSQGIVSYGASSLEDAPCYSAPLLVKSNGVVVDWETSQQKRTAEYRDCLSVLLVRLNAGELSKDETRDRWNELKLKYSIL